ncbi:hypothetical protein SY83_00965 [Paenibacillus swuensis]|uniref:Uncharacterized protein n=1 Tax=Paenibacillus swuensis TaxID=1178515 RepID=A0A172TDM8_9BACL|nr:DUF1128 domain-containing protein [Paenibacillus swuensis]ANE45145.1 hypothetical protein SY83_00965 [Paenibacillus swuensis]
MDLSHASITNIAYMLDEIKGKLKMASAAAIKPEHFDENQYEDIKDIYEIINSKANFSISEIEQLVSELGKLRKIV